MMMKTLQTLVKCLSSSSFCSTRWRNKQLKSSLLKKHWLASLQVEANHRQAISRELEALARNLIFLVWVDLEQGRGQALEDLVSGQAQELVALFSELLQQQAEVGSQQASVH